MKGPVASQSMEGEVPVDVLEALVPVQDHVAPAHSPEPVDDEVHHILKVPIKQKG